MSSVSWQNALSFCLILAVLLAMFALATPVLAAVDPVEIPQTSVPSQGFRGDTWLFVFQCNVSSSCYAFAVGTRTYFASPAPTNSSPKELHYDTSGNYVGFINLSSYDTTYSLSYGYENFLASSTLPVYSSLSSGLAAVRQYIDTPPSPSPSPSPLSYSLPPGNVAYIPLPSGQSSAITYTLTTTYYMAFGNNDTSRINQVVTVMSSLPSTSNNLAPTSPKIPWTNNGNVNLLGVSANKIYQGSIPANYGGQYLVVVNPLTMPSQSGSIGGDTYTNGSINITVSAVSGSPHIYPMSESLTISPGDGIGSESSYGDSAFTYEVDPETGEVIWTDPYGGSTSPVAGGNNPMPSPSTIFDWLRNISLQIADFLRGPVQAVQVVVSAIRDFMGSFTLLYQWLPGPVYSLITSALMVALTIGVIKIFV